MQKQDYEKLESLLGYTNSVDVLYEKLYELEIAGLKSSEEYKNHLEYLTIALEVEAEQYEGISLDRSQDIITFLDSEVIPMDFMDDVECVLSQKNENRAVRRILAILGNKVLLDDNFVKNVIPECIMDILYAIGMPNPEETVAHGINVSVQMNKVLQDETMNTFLSFVQEAIEDTNNQPFIAELLKVKYDIAFINKSVEAGMLTNNFDVQKSLMLSSKLTSDMLGIQDRLYELLKNGYGISVMTYQISEMLQISDLDYSIKNKAISSILREAIMRSALLLMDAEAIMDINTDYHDLVDDPKNAQIYEYSKISQSMIIRAFKKTKEDKEKYPVLSIVK